MLPARCCLVLFTTLVALSVSSVAAADDTPAGDQLVATQLTPGSSITAGGTVALLRFDGTGTSAGNAFPLPVAAAGPNRPFTLDNDKAVTGAVTRSSDGRYVVVAGYAAPPGTASVGSSLTTGTGAIPRVVARVDGNGDVDSSTTLGNAFYADNVRGVTTDDGTRFWVTGNGNNGGAPLKAGTVLQQLGESDNATPIQSGGSGNSNTRAALLMGGSLFISSEKTTPAGVFRLGPAGAPPTTAATSTSLISAGADGTPPDAFVLLKRDPASTGPFDTAYVLIPGTAAGNGILKFSSANGGTSWTARGSITGEDFHQLTAKVNADGSARLYAVAGTTRIVRITDTAAPAATPVTTSTTIATAPAGTVMRGIAFAPSPTAATVPSVPGTPVGTARSTVVDLTWTAPAGTGGSPISSYTITPYVGGVAQTPVVTGSSLTSRTVTGLTNGTTYTFTVRATNMLGDGPESAQSAPLTPDANAAATPTITLGAGGLANALGDPTQPTVDVTVAQADTDASQLTVAATSSSSTAVATTSGVTVSGSGATRTVSVTPAGGVGRTTIRLTVTGVGGKTAFVDLPYAVSQAGTSATRYYAGASDGSVGIDAGDGFFLVGDDESNTLRLYRQEQSGVAVRSWDFSAQIGVSATDPEIDIEGATRKGDTIWWTGSLGNSKGGNLRPNRAFVFSTTLSGSGASTQLAFRGSTSRLRSDLIAWDQANGDRFGFAAGAAAGMAPKMVNGFNVEGLEFAADGSSTAYVGFRAPLSPATDSGKALVVPVTNFDALAASAGASVPATFGDPILWDLGGLSIRELRRTASGQFLIIAGSYASGGTFRVYLWDGDPTHPPVASTTAVPTGLGDTGVEDPGSWEGFVSVPDAVTDGSTIRLLMDNGSTDLYGTGEEAKALAPPELRKSRSESFTLAFPTPPGATVPGPPTDVAATPGPESATVTWTAPPTDGGSAITAYEITPSTGGVDGKATTVGPSARSAVVKPLVAGRPYTFTVRAVNIVGRSTPSATASATPAPGTPTVAPAELSRLRISRRGVVTYVLSVPARVRLLVEARRHGRFHRLRVVHVPALSVGRTRIELHTRRAQQLRVTARVAGATVTGHARSRR